MPLLATGISAFFISQLITKKEKFFFSTLHHLSIISIPISLLLYKFFQSTLDSRSAKLAQQMQFNGIEEFINSNGHTSQFFFVFAISIPFLFYGSFITTAFKVVPPKKSPQVYIAELLGAGFGCLISTLILDKTSIHFTLFLIFSSASASLSLFYKRLLTKTLLFIIPVIYYIALPPTTFTSTRVSNWSARDFKEKLRVEELSSQWTTLSKVQKLRTFYDKDVYVDSISIGDGKGLSYLQINRKGEIQISPFFTVELAKTFQPQKTLILFAGGGSELSSLHESMPDSKVTGVELNHKVIQASIDHPPFFLRDAVQSPNVEIINGDARLFLERTQEKFDLILYSWSGATITQYAGAILHTTQYTFTTEAIEQALQQLKQKGSLIIFGASKANLLLSLLKINKEKRLRPLSQSVIILAPSNSTDELWKNGGDNLVLIYSQQDITPQKINDLNSAASSFEYSIQISPHTKAPPHLSGLQEIINSSSHLEATKKIYEDTHLYFTAHTDDRPFVYQTSPPIQFSSTFWATKLKSFISSPLSSSPITLSLWMILLLLANFTFIQFKSHTDSNRPISDTFLFIGMVITGYFSTTMGILSTYKAILFTGNPALASSTIQLSLLGASSLGALIYIKSPKSRITTILICLTSILVYSVFHIEIMNKDANVFFSTIGYFKFILLLFFLVLISGFLFARIISQCSLYKTRSLNLFFASNLFAASAAAFSTPHFVENLGIQSTSQLCFFSLFCIVVYLLSSLFLKRNNSF